MDNFTDHILLSPFGTPLRLFHGTTTNFAELKSFHTDQVYGEYGPGIYLTPDARYANQYAEGDGGRILAGYAQVKRPLHISERFDYVRQKAGFDQNQSGEFLQKLRDEGYDSIVYTPKGKSVPEAVVLWDSQQFRPGFNPPASLRGTGQLPSPNTETQAATKIVPAARIGRHFGGSSRPIWGSNAFNHETATIDEYITDLKAGKASSPHHLQFYQNNSREIEARLQAERGPTAAQASAAASHTPSTSIESEIVEVSTRAERLAAAQTKAWSRASKAATRVGDLLEPIIPSAIRQEINWGANKALIGGALGVVALLGGSMMVDSIARHQHAGRSKRGVWHGTDTGAYLGFGAGLLTWGLTKNPGHTAAALGLGVLAGNALYDHKFRHGDTQMNLARNSMVAVSSMLTYHAASKATPWAVQSFTTHLARHVPLGVSQTLNELKTIPGLGMLLSQEALPLVAGALSVPIAHSIISRAMAKTRHRMSGGWEGASLLPSMQHNQAGSQDGRIHTGTVVQPGLPEVQVSAYGTLRTHYDMNQARRALLS